VFGCDLCQEVCPWNRHSQPSTEPTLAPLPDRVHPDLVELLLLTQEEFSTRFRGSAIKRAKRYGLARNAAIALGNARDPATIPALARALRQDPDPTVRGAAAWALGRIGGEAAREALEAAEAVEEDPEVREELAAAPTEVDPG